MHVMRGSNYFYIKYPGITFFGTKDFLHTGTAL